MHHLRFPALLLDLLVLLALLRCVTMAPSPRYFSPASWGERESVLSDSEAGLGRGIMDNPFLGLLGTRKQRGLKGHQINKRKCNTATCVTQRLADFLVRSSNTIGTVYAPTNVGSTTYGKRDLPQPPSYLPL
ncbi:calcitonin gene-related peptide [Takifugu rubripes]|uniref:Islet amyloid polypeptide n=2 Tax=Takifugu TaxID=31032 RepID=A0A5C6NBK3_9TELE|nr:islet amyloid polypeptide [Takifugu rubripes]XP_056878712.1 calcitonin gene-related peptide [Takifugu flavidus]TNM91398.1 hypothetical protein fugu_019778 [Takifugu bimaculatus]TWW64513.1 Islet amyloid polypeptide [Takifugu flavidus]|eukprot:XP_003977578.2 PREDICTED: islet amyloid polypeptide [Takifugu rubripes]